ncbi:hypothetical protein V2J09_009443 [Rumex salicifolius]
MIRRLPFGGLVQFSFGQFFMDKILELVASDAMSSLLISSLSAGSVENGVLPKKSLQTKEVTSNSKGGAGRQQGSGRNSYYPNTSYYNYNYPGCTATDITSQAP